MTEDPPRARLIALADESGTSLAALSRLIGRNPSYLQQFIRKGSPRKLEEGDRRRLADFFGVPEEELGGSEWARKSYDNSSPVSPEGSRASSGLPAAKLIEIPRLPLGASAGAGAFTAEELPLGQLYFSAAWLRELGLSNNSLSAITVTGDSMEKTLSDGDEILVDRDIARFRDGIHVIRRDDTLLVKRLQFTPPGRLSIISDNAAYSSEHGVPLDEVEVVGRVVWKGGRI